MSRCDPRSPRLLVRARPRRARSTASCCPCARPACPSCSSAPTSGAVVALEDRCAHRAYPLSAGDADRRHRPLRPVRLRLRRRRPVRQRADPAARALRGPRSRPIPSARSDGLVWVWLGEPGRAPLHRIPELPWLADDGWSTVSGEEDVLASFLLLHENFADVTQVPFVAPDIAPSVLGVTPPPLDVVVSETSVSLHRDFPPAPLPAWQAEIVGCPLDTPYRTEQSGFFPSPAVWVDHWDAQAEDGLVDPAALHASRHPDRRAQQSAPVGGQPRLRRSATAPSTSTWTAIFTDYYDRVIDAMEIAQEVLEIDGPGPEVNVNADAVGLKIREIVASLLTAEGA